MYRATPHTVSDVSPAELLFGHRIRDKLPSIRDQEVRQEVRDRDAEMKVKGIRAGVPHKDVTVGEEVLIKQPGTILTGARFENDTGIVKEVKGPVVTVQTPSRTIRHKNQIESFKQLDHEIPEPLPEVSPEDAAPDIPVDESVENFSVPVRRSQRTTEPLVWMKDFVMK